MPGKEALSFGLDGLIPSALYERYALITYFINF